MSREQLEGAKKLFFILLGVDIAVTVVIALSNTWGLGVLDDIQTGRREATPSLVSTMNFWDSFGWLAFLTLCAVGFGLVKWLNACYRFAKETLGATGFKNEGWSGIGWVFPVFHFFKPYQVINEIYRAGSRTYVQSDDWKKESGSGLLLTWWIFYAITHLIATVISKQMLREMWRDDLSFKQSIGQIEMATVLCVVSIIIAVLWFWVANLLTQRLLDRDATTLVNTPPTQNAYQVPISAPVVTTRPMFTTAHIQPTFSLQQTAMSAPITQTKSTTQLDEDAAYEMVANELESGKTDKGLWTRLWTEFDGDEKKTKIAYLRQRSEKLMNAERVRLQELERQNTEEMARLEHIQSVAAIERKRLESLSVAARVSEKLGTGFNELPRADEFFQAVRHGDLHSAFHFLKADEMYVAAVDSHSGNSALHIAVTENNSAMTRLLIQSGAPIALKNARGVSPVDLLKKYPEQMGIFREVGVI